MSENDFRLDNPMLVRWEFASEERLEKRNALYRRLVEGMDAHEVLFEAIKESAPTRVLEVGCGAGEMAARVRDELGAEIVATDTSERMVELTRQRGVEAHVADVQELPFGDGEFDCVFAGWVLYHVHDRERAIAECARVLRTGGRFITATLADENMSDLWDFLGSPRERSLGFSSTNGAEQLERCFTNVEAREANGVVVFSTPDDMTQFVAANMTRAHLAAVVPDFSEPVRVRTHHTIFVAGKA
ncbi:MAG TPA: class I SAM-dependent methyltransferase [Gaiellaceae bacterium]|jgi:SAM-dependent methyltransferase|nr:class I SAM-dependent methyltransferase [Gaiellaceae bacterium]